LRKLLVILTFFSLFIGACGSEDQQVIRIKGDDVGFFIFEDFFQSYNNQVPDVTFEFQGGGSQTGLNAMLDDTVQMVFTLKELNNEDLILLRNKNIYATKIELVKIPQIIIVNYQLPFNDLTFPQVKGIFTGFNQFRFWWSLAKTNRQDFMQLGAVELCTLDLRNGEASFFKEALGITDFPLDIKYFNHNYALIDYIAKNKSAIGTISMPFFTRADEVKIIYAGENLEATGYLLLDKKLEQNAHIQSMLYNLKKNLFQNKLFLRQKGIKIIEE